MPNEPTTFASDFKRFFLRGLSVIVPPMLTIAILLWAYRFIDANIGHHVTEIVLKGVSAGGTRPSWVSEEDALIYGEKLNEIDAAGNRLTWEYIQLRSPSVPERTKANVLWRVFFNKYHLHLIGFVLGIMLIYFLGYLLASFMGRSVWQLIDRSLFRIPFVKAVYPHVKQVTDMLLAEKKLDVSAVVAVEYPRKGLWALALAVGPGPIFANMRDKLSSEALTVFIMNSPTPFTGIPLWVRRDEVVQLDMSLDEAVRFCVSCGVVAPGGTQFLAIKAKSPWRPTGTNTPPVHADKTSTELEHHASNRDRQAF